MTARRAGVATAVLLAVVGVVVATSGSPDEPVRANPPSAAQPVLPGAGQPGGQGGVGTQHGVRSSSICKGKGPGMITASPIAIDDIAFIQPMGLTTGGHVTPIDHGYFYIKGAQANPPVEAAVYAPFDGIVSNVSRSVRGSDPRATSGPATYDDYAITIEATCTFRVHYSNLVRFAGALQKHLGEVGANEAVMPNFRVHAGDLIGYTGLPTARGIDLSVENDNLTLPGFVRPAQYVDSWKTHIADLFDFTAEPLRSQLLALDERDASPRWGKIDQDVDGKLVGNWYRVGSGGFNGLQHGAEGYWDGHLAVVYDGNDPAQVEVSFGNYEGAPQQFAVVGNTPDPAAVDVTTGIVKYELGQIERYSADTGQLWDNRTYLPHVRARANSRVQGTVLLQMVGKRSLKMEIFPNQRAFEVNGFDAGAQMYER